MRCLPSRTPALCLVVAFAACEGAPTNSPGHAPDLRMTQPGLASFESCAELEGYIEDTATAQMADQIDNSGGRWYAEDMAGGDGRNEGSPTTTSSPDYSQTNTQVAGVDEADFVKTDGHRVFYIVGRRLVVLKSWPADQARIESETPLEGWPTEMFLDGTRLVVFSHVAPPTFDSGSDSGGRESGGDWGWGWGWGATGVQVYDVSGPRPALRDSYVLGGSYSTSRRIGGVVRVVLSASVNWPELQYWADYDSSDPWAEKLAKSRLKTENERRIRARGLSDWLPQSAMRVAGKLVPVNPDCTRYYRPTTSTSLGLATVATINLDSLFPAVELTSVVAEAGVTYANHDSLYIATSGWWGFWGWWGRGTSQIDWDKTYLHKFSLAGADRVEYRGSGVVRGHINDQFSLDEHRGYLRIATTTWPVGQPNGTTTESENRVWVFAERSGQLTLIGATSPLAPGERIYSTRFFGDRGFVVTYRQVDPLFAIDLADPAVPKVLGELKIPGFSTYIHMLDADHLLTIGNDTEPTGNGGEVRNGVALQIFDVSDMTRPTLTAKTLVGTRSGYSEALWDHKAFNYFAKTGMLAIPFTDWVNTDSSDYWGSFQSTLKVFKIDKAGSITRVGEVSHKDLYQRNDQRHWYWWYGPYIRRSVQIESFVYSFSFAGIKVSPTANLSAPVAVLHLDPQASP